MSFSLIIFLYIYYAFLALWALFFWAVIYHMLKFGLKGFMTVFLLVVFVGVAGGMLLFSYNSLSQVDWSYQISIFTNLSGSDIFIN